MSPTVQGGENVHCTLCSAVGCLLQSLKCYTLVVSVVVTTGQCRTLLFINKTELLLVKLTLIDCMEKLYIYIFFFIFIKNFCLFYTLCPLDSFKTVCYINGEGKIAKKI